MDRLRKLRGSASMSQETIPHKGSLCKLEEEDNYILEICTETSSFELIYPKYDYEFCNRLFAILDTENTHQVSKNSVRDFVKKRCIVICKRDEDHSNDTFEEIWQAVVYSCKRSRDEQVSYLGLEGWMVFCRFLALAQYLEAKRKFAARHLQQTMRHRNAPRGSEVVVVDFPPEEPPTFLTPEILIEYEQTKKVPLPVPELDLDHSLLAAHDVRKTQHTGSVKIKLFGNSILSDLEFAVTFARSKNTEVVVRRSMGDIQWLDDTFRSQKILGGTLCGRILPPCPSNKKSSDDTAIQTAKAGVKSIRDAAKSWMGPLGSYLHTSTSEEKPKKPKQKKKNLLLPENYYNPNSPEGKARQLERYLNYLLEHPALSTSFPLNAILTASQSGLEAARQALLECNRASKEFKDQAPQLDDGKAGLTINTANFEWVRTAAQAAMALKVHGMLETTGLPAASAMLQHASLPTFGPAARMPDWDENDSSARDTASEATSQRGASNFEEGVVNDDGYDLLPLPVPAPERRILTVGSGIPNLADNLNYEERFHYGMGALDDRLQLVEEEDRASAFLADIAVDENIDKLREVIGSVDSTISRCLASVGSIGKAHRERHQLHVDVVQGLDSWPEMRGRFVSQRSLMKGVAGIAQSKEIYEEGDLSLIDDLSWQTSLAACAVVAAEDVRAAVRVSRTASNARAAASSAALSAQTACEKGGFVNLDEARAAQTRASIAQSHAIHAAVVEHEAATVKRRSTLALAHDVKTWNVHRKREMLQSCISFARSQYEATRRSVDSWTTLRDGFIGATISPSVVERRAVPTGTSVTLFDEGPRTIAQRPRVDPDEVTATIFQSGNAPGSPSIVAVEHSGLASSLAESLAPDASPEVLTQPSEPAKSSSSSEEADLPFAEAAPVESSTADLLGLGSMQYNHDDQSEFKDASQTEEKLSASMQSLVDGLMNWGGGFDDNEDMALPVGMAASIVMEQHHKITGDS